MVNMPNYSKVTVYITFAKPCYDVKDYFDQFAEAVNWANFVLFTRHRIIVHEPSIADRNMYEVSIEVPDTIESFESGRHLRGIASYLLKYYPDKFERFKSGTRLFTYYIVKQKENRDAE